jgi:hypothetical protein
LTVSRCEAVRTIPLDTQAMALSAWQMPALQTIDAEWEFVQEISVHECVALVALPPALRVVRDQLSLEGCPQLAALPASLEVLGRLHVRHCPSLVRLPPAMPPPQALELGESALDALPPGWDAVQLTWRGMAMSERQLFRAHTLRPDEILNERDVKLRRVLIERAGPAHMAGAATAAVIDHDEDAGSVRRLIQVPVAGAEPIAVLEVTSTAGVSHRRVPPFLTSCQHAAAWVAQYSQPGRTWHYGV